MPSVRILRRNYLCVSLQDTGARFVIVTCAQSIVDSFQVTSCRRTWTRYRRFSAIPRCSSLPKRIFWLHQAQSLSKMEDFVESAPSFLHGMILAGAISSMEVCVPFTRLLRLAARFLIHTKTSLKAMLFQLWACR